MRLYTLSIGLGVIIYEQLNLTTELSLGLYLVTLTFLLNLNTKNVKISFSKATLFPIIN